MRRLGRAPGEPHQSDGAWWGSPGARPNLRRFYSNYLFLLIPRSRRSTEPGPGSRGARCISQDRSVRRSGPELVELAAAGLAAGLGLGLPLLLAVPEDL